MKPGILEHRCSTIDSALVRRHAGFAEEKEAKVSAGEGADEGMVPDPGGSFVEVLAGAGLQELASDFVDKKLEGIYGGLVGDVPVVKAVTSLVRAVRGTRDLLFARKLIRFLRGVADVPPQQRLKVLMECSEEEGRQRVGETLLLILDRLTDFAKPQLIAAAFRSYLFEEIDYTAFLRLAQCIDTLDPSQLKHLTTFVENRKVPEDASQHFFRCGLARISFVPSGMYLLSGVERESPRSSIRANALAKQFVRAVLGQQV